MSDWAKTDETPELEKLVLATAPMRRRIAELEKDRARLDWFVMDTRFDKIGDVDTHELAYTIAVANGLEEPGVLEYREAYRMAIDAAMAAENTISFTAPKTKNAGPSNGD